MGRTCRAPIVHLQADRRDFEVSIESPIARIALNAATSLQMHQAYDDVRARREFTRDYRIWVDYSPTSRRSVGLQRITLQSHGRVILPVAESKQDFTLGYVASHGISAYLSDPVNTRDTKHDSSGD
jgi:hypothetical protein